MEDTGHGELLKKMRRKKETENLDYTLIRSQLQGDNLAGVHAGRTAATHSKHLAAQFTAPKHQRRAVRFAELNRIPGLLLNDDVPAPKKEKKINGARAFINPAKPREGMTPILLQKQKDNDQTFHQDVSRQEFAVLAVTLQEKADLAKEEDLNIDDGDHRSDEESAEAVAERERQSSKAEAIKKHKREAMQKKRAEQTEKALIKEKNCLNAKVLVADDYKAKRWDLYHSHAVDSQTAARKLFNEGVEAKAGLAKKNAANSKADAEEHESIDDGSNDEESKVHVSKGGIPKNTVSAREQMAAVL